MTFEEWAEQNRQVGFARSWDAAELAWNAGVEECAARLAREADLYEKDGTPGPLGLNRWGWRLIAETFRALAHAIRARATT